jgi:hypothetical protein
MNFHLSAELLEATRLTKAGHLTEATAALQRMLGAGPPVNGLTVQGRHGSPNIIDAPPPASSITPKAPGRRSGRARKGAAKSPRERYDDTGKAQDARKLRTRHRTSRTVSPNQAIAAVDGNSTAFVEKRGGLSMVDGPEMVQPRLAHPGNRSSATAPTTRHFEFKTRCLSRRWSIRFVALSTR